MSRFIVTMTKLSELNVSYYASMNNKTSVKVRGPFVEKFCIEKDSYIDGI